LHENIIHACLRDSGVVAEWHPYNFTAISHIQIVQRHYPAVSAQIGDVERFWTEGPSEPMQSLWQKLISPQGRPSSKICDALITKSRFNENLRAGKFIPCDFSFSVVVLNNSACKYELSMETKFNLFRLQID